MLDRHAFRWLGTMVDVVLDLTKWPLADCAYTAKSRYLPAPAL